MLWRLVQTFSICLISTFGFFVLLLMDYEWESALLAAATFAVIVTLLYFFIYQRGYSAISQEIFATFSLVGGYWLIFYALTQGQNHSPSFTHFILGLGLIFAIAPFLAVGLLQFKTFGINRPRAFPDQRHAGSNAILGGNSNSYSNSYSNSSNGNGYSSNWQVDNHENLDNRRNHGNRDITGTTTNDIQEDYLSRRYRSIEERGNPDAFKRLEDPYFPSQAYEWFWVNPLILGLGIAPGFILAILGGVTFGWRGIIPGFGIGFLTVAAVQAWLLWN